MDPLLHVLAELATIFGTLALCGGWVLFLRWRARRLERELLARPKPPCPHRTFRLIITVKAGGQKERTAMCCDCYRALPEIKIEERAS